MWIGYSSPKEFLVPENFEKSNVIMKGNRRIAKFGNILWYTNLDINKRHEEMILYAKYNDADYHKFENFDAINIDRTDDIPCDYNGIMGVPITFLNRYNPNQFTIIGLGIANLGLSVGVKPYKSEHKKYRKEVQKRGAVDGDLYMMRGNEVVVPYARVLIKKK